MALDVGHWTLGARRWTLDAGDWTLGAILRYLLLRQSADSEVEESFGWQSWMLDAGIRK